VIIACDVKGTLEGPKKKQVLRILDIFEKIGYSVVVWSSVYSYARDAVKSNKMTTAKAQEKADIWNTPKESFYSFAVEDDVGQGKWLAANKFIYVKDIPEEMTSVDLFVKELLEGQ